MRYGCPNSNCSFHEKKESIIKDGMYFRANDSRTIQRYKCLSCGRKFSNATFSLAFGQKKRRVNQKVLHLIGSSVSMKRIAKILDIHELTVKRKLIYLSKVAKKTQIEFLQSLRNNPIQHMQFDDLITNEHTKLKPLSISLAVDVRSRMILGAQVSYIPSFGHLAELSQKKYGFRKNTHKEMLENLFIKIEKSISKDALIESDEHNTYPDLVKKYFPYALYKRYKGGRGCVVGQGELKKLHFDPLFGINHTCAMLRANINRLVRKTWCTSKDPQMLQKHLDVFIYYHNKFLI